MRNAASSMEYAVDASTGISETRVRGPRTRGSTTKFLPVKAARARTTPCRSASTKLSIVVGPWERRSATGAEGEARRLPVLGAVSGHDALGGVTGRLAAPPAGSDFVPEP